MNQVFCGERPRTDLPSSVKAQLFTVSVSLSPTQPHRNSNTQRTKNKTTNVVIQENSRKLLMMDILMSETCWAHKKWNKIASDNKLVFYSSTITMMHSPINIRFLHVSARNGPSSGNQTKEMQHKTKLSKFCTQLTRDKRVKWLKYGHFFER